MVAFGAMQDSSQKPESGLAKDETIDEVLRGYDLNPLSSNEIVVFQIEKRPSFEG